MYEIEFFLVIRELIRYLIRRYCDATLINL